MASVGCALGAAAARAGMRLGDGRSVASGRASLEAAVPAMMQRTEQPRSRQRQLTHQLGHRSRMAPLRRGGELRHQLAARRKARQKCRQACQRRLDQVASSLSHIRQEADFGSQVATVLEQLLFEQEEDMVIMDPSLTITEQVRHRWLREYDECHAECEDLQRSLDECEQQHSDMLPEEKHLKQQIRHAEEVIEQLAQMCAPCVTGMPGHGTGERCVLPSSSSAYINNQPSSVNDSSSGIQHRRFPGWPRSRPSRCCTLCSALRCTCSSMFLFCRDV